MVIIALFAVTGCVAQNQLASAPAARADLSGALAGRGEAVPSITVMSPVSGETVTSPVAISVKFEHIRPTAAGATVDGEGHLHVMIDEPCVATGSPIPKDATHVHFGSGAAVIEVELEPGPHELCVQVGDGFHIAVAVTDILTVNVVTE